MMKTFDISNLHYLI